MPERKEPELDPKEGSSAGRFKRLALEYGLLIAAMTAIYPFIKGDGLFDQWFGLWWLLAFAGLPALIVLAGETYRRYRTRT